MLASLVWVGYAVGMADTENTVVLPAERAYAGAPYALTTIASIRFAHKTAGTFATFTTEDGRTVLAKIKF